jgi:hypothetical protein
LYCYWYRLKKLKRFNRYCKYLAKSTPRLKRFDIYFLKGEGRGNKKTGPESGTGFL